MEAEVGAILAALPNQLQRCIWTALPPEDRGRSACVCRAWRDALADVAMWTCLRPADPGLGGAAPGVRYRLMRTLRAAAAKAAGRLEVLDFAGLSFAVETALVLALVTANGATLRKLTVTFLSDLGGHNGLIALLQAAPRLQAFNLPNGAEATVVNVALRVLRNEGIFRPLRLGAVHFMGGPGVLDMHALVAAVTAHTSLRKLHFTGLVMPDLDALDALVDAALTLKIRELHLDGCTVPSAFASSLARLIRGRRVENVKLASIATTEAAMPFFDSAAVAVLAPALLSNTRLTNICLDGHEFWAEAEAAAALLTSLASHPSLTSVALCRIGPPPAAAVEVVAAALAAFVASNSLSSLVLNNNRLDDACLGPLFDALPSNTCLRLLHLTGNRLSWAFMRERVLPAVHANTSLTTLHLDTEHGDAREAMIFVRQRRGR